MPAGRPPQRYQHIAKLEADEEAKRRLEVILRTLAGEMRAIDAREALGLSESRFHELRAHTLQAAADSLVPRQGGRQRKTLSPEEQKIAELEDRVQALERDLMLERARVEIATLGLGRPPKKTRRKPTARSGQRSA